MPRDLFTKFFIQAKDIRTTDIHTHACTYTYNLGNWQIKFYPISHSPLYFLICRNTNSREFAKYMPSLFFSPATPHFFPPYTSSIRYYLVLVKIIIGKSTRASPIMNRMCGLSNTDRRNRPLQGKLRFIQWPRDINDMLDTENKCANARDKCSRDNDTKSRLWITAIIRCNEMSVLKYI